MREAPLQAGGGESSKGSGDRYEPIAVAEIVFSYCSPRAGGHPEGYSAPLRLAFNN